MEPKLIRRATGAMLEKRASLEPTDDDMALIAAQVPEGWPTPTAADVYIASALVCNDLVDTYDTKFSDNALTQIAALMPGCNVMRNHADYGSGDLPVARAFAGERITMPDGTYVRARFYWPRRTAFGQEMAENMALGLWREVSLSWMCRSFLNSIDMQPMSKSPYYPGQVLADGRTVIGIFDDIEQLFEFSIVHLGGQLNTSVNPVQRQGEFAEADDLILAARARIAAPKPPNPWERWFKAA